MITTVLFDLDGTLLDTLDDLADSMNYVLERYGYPLRSTSEIRSFVGNGIRRLIERSVPMGTDDDTVSECMTLFKSHYGKHLMDKTKPYDGITELLSLLKAKGIKTGIISNKLDESVKALCAHYFDGLYDIAVGESKNVRKKPSPDSVLKAMEFLNSRPGETVYIGDSDIDIQTAGNAGIRCISVLWGFRDEEFLKINGASQTASDVCELSKILLM